MVSLIFIVGMFLFCLFDELNSATFGHFGILIRDGWDDFIRSYTKEGSRWILFGVTVIVFWILPYIVIPAISTVIYWVKILIVLLKIKLRGVRVKAYRTKIINSQRKLVFDIGDNRFLFFPLHRSSNKIITINDENEFSVSTIVRNIKGGQVRGGAIQAQGDEKNYELSKEKKYNITLTDVKTVIVFFPHPKSLQKRNDEIIAESSVWTINNVSFQTYRYFLKNLNF